MSVARNRFPFFDKAFILWISLFLLHGCATRGPIEIKSALRSGDRVLKADDIKIEKPKAVFSVGEKVVYEVRWIGIPVGNVVSTIKAIEEIGGRKAYVIELVAKTNDFASKIYRIEDVYTSYMDVERLVSLKHEVRRREGRYRKDAVTVFDQENHKAYFENFLDKSKKEFVIPPDVQDPLTAIYYFRTLDLKHKDKIYYRVVNNEAVYELYGLIKKKCFIQIGASGPYETFYVVPYAILKGERVKKGKASGYISVDGSRLPILGIVKAPLFTKITASLLEKTEI